MGGPSKPGLGRSAADVASDPKARDRMDEHRGSLRRPTFKYGAIMRDDGAPLDCIVRNVSESGCMVKIDDTEQIPDVVRIRIDLDQPARRAEVVWRSATLAGLMFTEEPH